jgi:hypothetical protein
MGAFPKQAKIQLLSLTLMAMAGCKTTRGSESLVQNKDSSQTMTIKNIKSLIKHSDVAFLQPAEIRYNPRYNSVEALDQSGTKFASLSARHHRFSEDKSFSEPWCDTDAGEYAMLWHNPDESLVSIAICFDAQRFPLDEAYVMHPEEVIHWPSQLHLEGEPATSKTSTFKITNIVPLINSDVESFLVPQTIEFRLKNQLEHVEAFSAAGDSISNFGARDRFHGENRTAFAGSWCDTSDGGYAALWQNTRKMTLAVVICFNKNKQALNQAYVMESGSARFWPNQLKRVNDALNPDEKNTTDRLGNALDQLLP